MKSVVAINDIACINRTVVRACTVKGAKRVGVTPERLVCLLSTSTVWLSPWIWTGIPKSSISGHGAVLIAGEVGIVLAG